MQSAAFVASMPPIATTGIDTASQTSRSPSSLIGGGAARFAGVPPHRARPVIRAPRGPPPARIAAPEMHAVGAQRKRSLDVVVDHERCGQVDEGPPGLDHVPGRSSLEPELDHGRPALDRADGGLEFRHDRGPPPPSTFARESSVAGSRLYSAS